MRYIVECLRLAFELGSRLSYHELVLVLGGMTLVICTILMVSGRRAA